ncbi:MAG: hypothetical protein FJ288_02170 [Planctomycetes bacterium]|nr:hypothetical protein [Planctomycetota bacterium]
MSAARGSPGRRGGGPPRRTCRTASTERPAPAHRAPGSTPARPQAEGNWRCRRPPPARSRVRPARPSRCRSRCAAG